LVQGCTVEYGLNTYRELYEAEHDIERPHLSQIASQEQRTKAQLMYLRRMKGNVHPHNEPLQAWVGMGIPGLFFYGALFAATFVTFFRFRRLKPDAFSSSMNLAVFAWYIGHTIPGLFHCFFFSERTFSVAAVMYALMFGALYLSGSAKDANERAGKASPPNDSPEQQAG